MREQQGCGLLLELLLQVPRLVVDLSISARMRVQIEAARFCSFRGTSNLSEGQWGRTIVPYQWPLLEISCQDPSAAFSS